MLDDWVPAGDNCDQPDEREHGGRLESLGVNVDGWWGPTNYWFDACLNNRPGDAPLDVDATPPVASS
ncbi:hypothetical protein GUITHDRAFT_108507 [Guillardia theta CCMP2712]|uniref:Uncharacterized protein n=1 Tax=Guillardia theta (strain CCMP2712) TaxID=905079 RepID=L1JAS5_GUITC|nr:hypothetical protein GUITHDRAFT_108507 [Guillardia theta CCMP2712]EKX45631.1 hypothetical protein GUITHDRAFT_108507 [Guillardia theta CCMP2712]|eukprot:XP_005832611.1 hypothetical protein GUITHDRAFT_108507 [Guillardia theta CCMP2712]